MVMTSAKRKRRFKLTPNVLATIRHVPQSMDWRKHGVLNPVRRQGRCNCCWAAVACAAVESRYGVAGLAMKKPLFKLSIQELVDKLTPKDKNATPDKAGCFPLSVNKAFRYMMERGVRYDEDYPYEFKRNDTCKPRDESTKVVMIEDYIKLDDDAEDHENILLYLVSKRPVAAAIVIHDDFLKVGKGIYMGPGPNPTQDAEMHAVLVVGYGHDEEAKTDYWIVMSSRGETWGDKGFARVCLVPDLISPALQGVQYI